MNEHSRIEFGFFCRKAFINVTLFKTNEKIRDKQSEITFMSDEIFQIRFDMNENIKNIFFFFLNYIVESEPIADERIRILVDDELKSFGIKQGDSTKKIEDLNIEFIKNHSNSLAHRAEGRYPIFR